MLTVQQVKDLRKQFKAAKIKVNLAEATVGDDLLIRIEDDETVTIQPGEVDIKVFVDPTERQLVMWADEKARKHTEVCKWWVGAEAKFTTAQRKTFVRDCEAGSYFPIGLPEGTTYKVQKVWQGKSFKLDDDNAAYAYAEVVATVPATNQTFLIGTDEHSQFVCGLPKRVKSVQAAHEALRPKGVPKNAPRQGEWFFVPVTAKERKLIEADIADYPRVTTRHLIDSTWLGSALDTENENLRYYYPDDTYHDCDDDTSHVALTAHKVQIEKEHILFVRGYIVDDRSPENRNSRHAPMWLNDWHRPVRNLEVQFDSQDSETWD